MINSYLTLNGISLPVGAEAPLPQLRANSSPAFSFDKISQELIHRMAQHALCDGLGFSDIYSLESVAFEHPLGSIYGEILLDIAVTMRAGLAEKPFQPHPHWRHRDDTPIFEPEGPVPVQSCQPSQSQPGRLWLRLGAQFLSAKGLPDGQSYPLLEGLVDDPWREVKLSHLLFSLMAYLATHPGSRSKYEGATLGLARLISAYAPTHHHVDGDVRLPRFGPVHQEQEMLTLQHESTILLALGRHDRTVHFECYRPLCLSGCELLRSPLGWEDRIHLHSLPVSRARAEQGLTYRDYLPSGIQHRLQPLGREIIWTQMAVARLYAGVGNSCPAPCQALGFGSD
ncbi:MAG: hypothetical protein U0931_27545 [Vulcanimicrobiota bacterium]